MSEDVENIVTGAAMKVFMTAYDVNPFKGSESGMGWNFANGLANFCEIILVTRENNKESIEKYAKQFGRNKNLTVLYYDLGPIILFLKARQRFWAVYYYLWQLGLAIKYRKLISESDVSHSLNFHSDLFPSFLWLFNPKFVWGPINHHEKIPEQLLWPNRGFTYLKVTLFWCIKRLNWAANPLLHLCAKKAKVIFVGSSAVQKRIAHASSSEMVQMSSVGVDPSFAAENRSLGLSHKSGEGFILLSVGRLVPMKGFDLAIRAYGKWLLSKPESVQSKLVIVGAGPLREFLEGMAAAKVGSNGLVEFVDWLPREELIKYYLSAKAFLFPSHEGAGMVVAEAMQFDLPIICLKNNGPSEIAKTASLTASIASLDQTVDSLASHIDSAYLCDEKFKRAKKNCSKILVDLYWAKKSLIIFDKYKRIMGDDEK